MPWKDATTIPFNRIEIVSRVPSESGVFAVMDGHFCLLIGDTWNLKARLLELVNVPDAHAQLTIVFETCPDDQRESRKRHLSVELIHPSSNEPEVPDRRFPGIALRDILRRSA